MPRNAGDGATVIPLRPAEIDPGAADRAAYAALADAANAAMERPGISPECRSTLLRARRAAWRLVEDLAPEETV